MQLRFTSSLHPLALSLPLLTLFFTPSPPHTHSLRPPPEFSPLPLSLSLPPSIPLFCCLYATPAESCQQCVSTGEGSAQDEQGKSLGKGGPLQEKKILLLEAPHTPTTPLDLHSLFSPSDM